MASAPAPDHTGNTLKKSKYKHFGDEDKDDFDNESLSDLDIFNELSSKLVDLFKKQDEENKTYKYIIIPQGVEEVDKQELYEMAKSASLQGQLKIWKNYKIEDKEKREKTRKLILFTTKLLEDNSKYTYKGSTWQIRKWMTKEQLDEKYRQLALQNEENKKKYEERQRRQREWEKNQELWKKKQEEIQKRKEQGIRKIRLAMINVYNLPQIFNKEILIEIGRTLGDCVSIRYPNEDDLSYGAVTFYFKKVYSDIDEGKYIHIGRMRIKYIIPKWVYDAQDIFYVERPENYRDLIIPDDKILDRKAKVPIFTEKINENQNQNQNEKILDKFNYTKTKTINNQKSNEDKENMKMADNVVIDKIHTNNQMEDDQITSSDSEDNDGVIVQKVQEQEKQNNVKINNQINKNLNNTKVSPIQRIENFLSFLPGKITQSPFAVKAINQAVTPLRAQQEANKQQSRTQKVVPNPLAELVDQNKSKIQQKDKSRLKSLNSMSNKTIETKKDTSNSTQSNKLKRNRSSTDLTPDKSTNKEQRTQSPVNTGDC